VYYGNLSLRNVVDLANYLDNLRHFLPALCVVPAAQPLKIKQGPMAVSLSNVGHGSRLIDCANSF
jgi:hypothetical protein